MAEGRETEHRVWSLTNVAGGPPLGDEELAATAAELIDVPMLFCEPRGTVVYANGSWQACFGVPGVTSVGAELRELVGCEVAESLLCCGREVSELRVMLKEPRAGGHVAVRVRARYHEGREGRRYLCLAFDGRWLPRRESGAVLFEAGARMAGEVAHDLNNELSVLMNYSAMVARSLPCDAVPRALVREMQQTAWRASKVSQALLGFGWAAERRDTCMPVSDLVDAILPLLHMLSGGRRSVTVEMDDGGLSCLLPRARIELFLMHCVASESGIAGEEPKGVGPSPLHIRVTASSGEPSDRTVSLRIGPVAGRFFLQESGAVAGADSVMMEKLGEAMARCGGRLAWHRSDDDGLANVALHFASGNHL